MNVTEAEAGDSALVSRQAVHELSVPRPRLCGVYLGGCGCGAGSLGDVLPGDRPVSTRRGLCVESLADEFLVLTDSVMNF